MRKLYRLLRLFFSPKCMHRWINHGDRQHNTLDEYNKVVAIRYERMCYCAKCGEWTTFKV